MVIMVGVIMQHLFVTCNSVPCAFSMCPYRLYCKALNLDYMVYNPHCVILFPASQQQPLLYT